MRVLFRIFESERSTWDALCREAAEIAGTLDRARLITIAHSESVQMNGVVIVWYWGEAGS